jgi:hypothetical protein
VINPSQSISPEVQGLDKSEFSDYQRAPLPSKQKLLEQNLESARWLGRAEYLRESPPPEEGRGKLVFWDQFRILVSWIWPPTSSACDNE